MAMLSLRTIGLDDSGRVNQADFSVVSGWFRARGGGAPAREMLPTCGAVAEFDGQPAGIGFLYLDATGSGVAWLAWLATNPGLPRIQAGKAAMHLINFLCELAKGMNYWLVMAAYNTPSLNRLLSRKGFATGDRGATLQFKPI